MEALENVIDPELGLDFVSLGLVYDVEVEGSDVHITFTLTSPGCPIGPQVTRADEGVRQRGRGRREGASRRWSSHRRGRRSACPRTRSSRSGTSAPLRYKDRRASLATGVLSSRRVADAAAPPISDAHMPVATRFGLLPLHDPRICAFTNELESARRAGAGLTPARRTASVLRPVAHDCRGLGATAGCNATEAVALRELVQTDRAASPGESSGPPKHRDRLIRDAFGTPANVAPPTSSDQHLHLVVGRSRGGRRSRRCGRGPRHVGASAVRVRRAHGRLGRRLCRRLHDGNESGGPMCAVGAVHCVIGRYERQPQGRRSLRPRVARLGGYGDQEAQRREPSEQQCEPLGSTHHRPAPSVPPW